MAKPQSFPTEQTHGAILPNTAEVPIAPTAQPGPLLKLPSVLRIFPVSRSAWLAGVKTGKYPAPVRLSARSVAWRASDLAALVSSL